MATKKPRPIRVLEASCPHCSASFSFQLRRRPRTYCSPGCSKQAHRIQIARWKAEHGGPPLPEDKPCSICSAPFKPASGRQKYCGDECAAKGLIAIWAKKRKERRAEG